MTISFASFFLGGFECSCHVRRDGRRLDLLDSTGHAAWAVEDYGSLLDHGIRSARDGVRWHRIEAEPGRYDWSDLHTLARAARRSGMQVVWDLCHYGWPPHLDIWSSAFPRGFARFAREAASVLADVAGAPPLLCPINEISYWAWAGGDVGLFGPCAIGKGPALKRQLVRAWIAAAEAIREAVPGCRLVCAEPAIHVDPGGLATPDEALAAEKHRLSQFEAVDLLLGRREPELGGGRECLDALGLNYYPDNQWYHGGRTIPLGHHAYRPLSSLLREWRDRYGLPMFLAETGAEGSARASWLHYVCGEVEEARRRGVAVDGICLYPVVDYLGWENGRSCATGLLSAPDERGRRRVHEPLAAELRAQRARLDVDLGANAGGPARRRADRRARRLLLAGAA